VLVGRVVRIVGARGRREDVSRGIFDRCSDGRYSDIKELIDKQDLEAQKLEAQKSEQKRQNAQYKLENFVCTTPDLYPKTDSTTKVEIMALKNSTRNSTRNRNSTKNSRARNPEKSNVKINQHTEYMKHRRRQPTLDTDVILAVSRSLLPMPQPQASKVSQRQKHQNKKYCGSRRRCRD
jgi:hypothetical protein